MSVEQLNFYSDEDKIADLEVKYEKDNIVLKMWNSSTGIRKQLYRDQAHLLMLYLQEHLK